MKSKINIQLLLGGILLIIMLLVIIFPGQITDNNPYGLDFFRTTYIDGKRHPGWTARPAATRRAGAPAARR